MSDIRDQINYKPLIISHLLRPIGEKFTSSFAINLEWNQGIGESELKKDRDRFTKFLTKFAKQEEKISDGLFGGITVHIIAPPRYLDKHLSDFVKPKRFEIKHWNLVEKWWMIPDDKMREIREHYNNLSKLTTETQEVFEKISVHRCNRIPSKFPIKSKNELVWVLLAKLNDYQYGRFSIKETDFRQTGIITNKYNDIGKVNKVHIKKSWGVLVDLTPPTRIAPMRPIKTRRKQAKFKSSWISVPRDNCRLSLVKVLGEYWGWDFFYTQFRVKKITTPMSRSEIVIQELINPTRSLFKHLIWCFREHKLWFESLEKTREILSTLI
jgi:hypothetical protein